MASPQYIRRYTDITSLLHILRNRQITLLDPKSWDDSNDAHFMAIYKRKKKLKTLLALCLSETPETYHHWRVFAPGSSGVCIRFVRATFLKRIRNRKGIRTNTVTYMNLGEMRKHKAALEELPFLKRSAFEHENEFRIIFESDSERLEAKSIPISLSFIDRVTLSPWMHSSLSDDVKATLHSIDGCEKLEIYRSTLIGNESWKRYGEEAE